MMKRTWLGWTITAITAVSAFSCGSDDDSTTNGGTGGAGTGAKAGTGASAGTGGGSVGGSGGTGGGEAGAGGGTSGTGGTAGAACTGTHPIVDGGARYCDPSECRCVASDLCFSQATSAACCEGPRECFTPDGGVECKGNHPLVDGSVRFCEPGVCYCAANDSCFPSAIAAICCNAPQCG